MWVSGPPGDEQRGRGDRRQPLPHRYVAAVDLADDCGHHRPIKTKFALGPLGKWPVPAERWRRVLDDEPLDSVGPLLRDQVGLRAAHGVTEQCHLAEAQVVQQLYDVVRHELERLRPRPVALTVPAQVDRDQLELLRQSRSDRCPIAAIFAQRMQQHQWWSSRGAAHLVCEAHFPEDRVLDIAQRPNLLRHLWTSCRSACNPEARTRDERAAFSDVSTAASVAPGSPLLVGVPPPKTALPGRVAAAHRRQLMSHGPVRTP